jgi:hypothetical protein
MILFRDDLTAYQPLFTVEKLDNPESVFEDRCIYTCRIVGTKQGKFLDNKLFTKDAILYKSK